MAKDDFTDEQVKKRAVKRGADVLFQLWEEGRGAHSRLLEVLVPDSNITLGISINGPGWKEHVVPLSFIRDYCFSIFEQGGGINEAAEFIDTHLKIVYISPAERQKLDFELCLKGKMPESWEPGDYLARLNAAGIKLYESLQF